MVPDLSHRWYPAGVSSCTFSMAFYGRQTKGTGAWATISGALVPSLASLSIVYPTGNAVGVPWDSIVDAIVTHVLNSGLMSWWSPPGGIEPRTAISAALSSLVPPVSVGSFSAALWFDGQFGSVYAA